MPASVLTVVLTIALKSLSFHFSATMQQRSPSLFSTGCLTGQHVAPISLYWYYINDRHVLRHLFPSEKRRIYDLRSRVHNFTLPLKDNNNFIPRVLFWLWDIGPTAVYFLLNPLY